MSDSVDNNRVQSDTLTTENTAPPRMQSLSDRVRSLRLANPTAARGSRFGWLPWILCVVFLFAGAAAGVMGADLMKFLPTAKPAAEATDTTKAGSGDVALEQKGYIIPSRTYQVSPKVGGMVQKLNIQKEGDFFEKGKVLAEIEDVDYRADFDHATFALNNAKERLAQLRKELPEEIKKAEYDLEQAKSQLRQYVLDLERAQELFHRQSISKSDLDSSRAIKEAKESEVNKLTHAHRLVTGSAGERIRALEAEVAQDDADLTKAKWRLGNCVIVAPETGTILTKNVEEGNLANPVALQSVISASICTMADLSKLEVDISIQERDIMHVSEGQPCRIKAEGFPDRKEYPGKVIRIMPNADRAKGAIPVRVKLLSLQPGEKPGQYLRPDTGVIVSFLKREAKDDNATDGK